MRPVARLQPEGGEDLQVANALVGGVSRGFPGEAIDELEAVALESADIVALEEGLQQVEGMQGGFAWRMGGGGGEDDGLLGVAGLGILDRSPLSGAAEVAGADAQQGPQARAGRGAGGRVQDLSEGVAVWQDAAERGAEEADPPAGVGMGLRALAVEVAALAPLQPSCVSRAARRRRALGSGRTMP